MTPDDENTKKRRLHGGYSLYMYTVYCLQMYNIYHTFIVLHTRIYYISEYTLH